jgi:hypothetical protein
MTRDPSPLFDPEHGVDPAAVAHDDAVLDEVGRRDLPAPRGRHRDPIAEMLADMRERSDAAGEPELVSLQDAEFALATARRRYRAEQRRDTWLMLLVFLFAVGGIGLLLWVG